MGDHCDGRDVVFNSESWMHGKRWSKPISVGPRWPSSVNTFLRDPSDVRKRRLLTSDLNFFLFRLAPSTDREAGEQANYHFKQDNA